MFHYPGQKRGKTRVDKNRKQQQQQQQQQQQKQRNSSGNSWAEQDEALFGGPASASATSSSSYTYCEPCTNTNDRKPSAKIKPLADPLQVRARRESTQGLPARGNQLSSLAGNASSKLSNFISKAKDEVTKATQEVKQRTNNVHNSTNDRNQPRGTASIPPINRPPSTGTSNDTPRTGKKKGTLPNNHHHKPLHHTGTSNSSALPSFTTAVPQPPSTSTNNRQNISRMVTNAIASQVPLRCAHCSSFPLMFHAHPFFGSTQRICSTHPLQSVVRCVSCSRFQPKNEPFTPIGTSSARICTACARTAILDNNAAMILYEHVLQFMESQGLDMFGEKMREFPVLLSDENNMNRQSSSIGCDANTQKRGLTIWSEVHLPIPDVVQLAKSASKAIRRVARGKHARGSRNQSEGDGDGDGDVKRNMWSGSRHVQVQKILCLKGLPRNLMGSILAHEATHAWLAINPVRRDGVVGDDSSFGSVRRIDPTIEEGICQLVSHLYLQMLMANDQKERFRDNFNRDGPTNVKLNQYFKWSIENHSSPIYGGGFKKAARAYTQIVESGGGLKELLQYVTIHRDFPPV